MARVFKQITPEFVQWNEVGQTVEGAIVEISTVAGKFGEAKMLTLRPDEGPPVKLFASAKFQEVEEQLTQGTYIRVTYKGEIETGEGQPMKDLDIFIAVQDE